MRIQKVNSPERAGSNINPEGCLKKHLLNISQGGVKEKGEESLKHPRNRITQSLQRVKGLNFYGLKRKRNK